MEMMRGFSMPSVMVAGSVVAAEIIFAARFEDAMSYVRATRQHVR
jgi:hypothetical protein